MKNKVGFWECFWVFFKIGLLSIGGGYAMIPPMIVEVVNRKKWVAEENVMDSYALGQSIPGIIAVNTSAFLGYHIGRIKGAISAIIGCILPSFVIILLIARVYKVFSNNPYVEGALKGIRIAVLAMLITTVIDLTKKSFKDITGVVLATIALGCLVLGVSAIFVIIGGIILSGLIYYRKEKAANEDNN